MKNNNLVSVIIPTFNSSRTIETCLKSIRKQSFTNIEILVIDSKSSDSTPFFAKKYANVYSVKGNRSVGRNFGLQKSNGEYVLFIDSDMELTPNLIKECRNLSNSTCAIVIPEISKGEGFWTKCRMLERRCYYGDNTIEAARFFPRKIINRLKGYDPTLSGAEDWDLHQKLLKNNIYIKRTKGIIIHDEGKITLKSTARKKMYYGKVFKEYKKRYPLAFTKAFIRTSYIRHLPMLTKDPIHFAGMIVLKTVEGIALTYGMIKN